MLKKSDILPLILAFITTILIVGLGFLFFTKINTAKLSAKQKVNPSNSNNSDQRTQLNSQSSASLTEVTTDPEEVFVLPAIVPEGTAVIINGSRKIDHINQALRKGFHQEFPRTAITTYADGNQLAIDLLISGDIDIAAIDRPLKQTETAKGLAAIIIHQTTVEKQNQPTEKLYYAYQKPANMEVKAFLGYVLSSQGQRTINQS